MYAGKAPTFSTGWISLKSGTTVIPKSFRGSTMPAIQLVEIEEFMQKPMALSTLKKLKQHQQTYKAKRNKRTPLDANRLNFQWHKLKVLYYACAFVHFSILPTSTTTMPLLKLISSNPLKIYGWRDDDISLMSFGLFSGRVHSLQPEWVARSIVPFLSSTSSV